MAFFPRCRISLNGPRNQRAAPNYTVYVDRFTTVAWITIALAALVLAVGFVIVSQAGRDSNVFGSFRKFSSVSQSVIWSTNCPY